PSDLVAIGPPSLVQDLPDLPSPVAARAQPDSGHHIAEPSPAQPGPDQVPGGPLGFRGTGEDDGPVAAQAPGPRGEAEDALGAVAQQPRGGGGKPPHRAPADTLG